jgi:predicted nucleic acid-binding protein
VEIAAGPEVDPAKAWIKSDRGARYAVPEVPIPAEIAAWDLGAGETAVIALAFGRQNTLCVLDDLAARKCAEVFDLPVIGTLGILLRAKVAGLIPQLHPEITKLLAVGSLLAPAVIQRACALVGE